MGIFNLYSFRVIYSWNLLSIFWNSLLFNMLNSFNVSIESFQTIYRTDILYTIISSKASFF